MSSGVNLLFQRSCRRGQIAHLGCDVILTKPLQSGIQHYVRFVWRLLRAQQKSGGMRRGWVQAITDAAGVLSVTFTLGYAK